MQKKRLCRILTAVWLMAVSAAISFPVCNSFAASEDGAEIQKVYWEGKTARWVANGRFVEYEVELYRDGDRIAKNTVKGSRKDFATHMVRGADYYFRVGGIRTAVAIRTGRNRMWLRWKKRKIRSQRMLPLRFRPRRVA